MGEGLRRRAPLREDDSDIGEKGLPSRFAPESPSVAAGGLSPLERRWNCFNGGSRGLPMAPQGSERPEQGLQNEGAHFCKSLPSPLLLKSARLAEEKVCKMLD